LGVAACPTPDSRPDDTNYDIAIVGAGVVGCALACELSRYRLRTILIDKNHDVGEGTSKANSAIIHTGFDATPGTLESQLVTGASLIWPELAAKLKVPMLQTGAIVLAVDEEQERTLKLIHRKALDNGVDDVELVDAETARRLEPHATPRVRGGLLVPRESVIDSFGVSIATTEIALANGVDVLLGCGVTAMADCDSAIKTLKCDGETVVRTRTVINVAGLWSRGIADLYGGQAFEINPRRGQFLLYDSQCRHMVNRILLPIPTKTTKGKLVAPTIFGNILTGPTAEDLPLEALEDTSTTPEGLEEVATGAAKLCPEIIDQPTIAAFAGLRCNCEQGSYLIRCNDGHPGFITVTGIRSTGLTTSPMLARHLIEQMTKQCDLELVPNHEAMDARPESAWPGWWKKPYDTPAIVSARPEYGHVICTCEQISRGEILDAMRSPLHPRTLDGLKRRTRALMGRCQGFNCLAPIARTVCEHFKLPMQAVTKCGPSSEIVSAVQTSPFERTAISYPKAPAEIPTHYRVAIVGAGPAGIGVAVGLARSGVESVVLIERADTLGGVPAKYEPKRGGVPTFVIPSRGRILYGRQYVDLLAGKLDRTSTVRHLNTQVLDAGLNDKSLTIVSPTLGKRTITADAIILACGSREQTRAERGWISGSRPARVFHTMQLLDLLDGDHCLPSIAPVVIGSDLIAWSAAAKLKAAGADQVAMLDLCARPKSPFLSRLYFKRWCRPAWRSVNSGVTMEGTTSATGIGFRDGTSLMCDGVILSGMLVPNSELIVSAGLDVIHSDRIPLVGLNHSLSEAGWFAAGNVIGGFHSAHWCYRHGKKMARSVAGYLDQSERRT